MGQFVISYQSNLYFFNIFLDYYMRFPYYSMLICILGLFEMLY